MRWLHRGALAGTTGKRNSNRTTNLQSTCTHPSCMIRGRGSLRRSEVRRSSHRSMRGRSGRFLRDTLRGGCSRQGKRVHRSPLRSTHCCTRTARMKPKTTAASKRRRAGNERRKERKPREMSENQRAAAITSAQAHTPHTQKHTQNTHARTHHTLTWRAWPSGTSSLPPVLPPWPPPDNDGSSS